jgi:hypothetical protein
VLLLGIFLALYVGLLEEELAKETISRCCWPRERERGTKRFVSGRVAVMRNSLSTEIVPVSFFYTILGQLNTIIKH